MIRCFWGRRDLGFGFQLAEESSQIAAIVGVNFHLRELFVNHRQAVGSGFGGLRVDKSPAGIGVEKALEDVDELTVDAHIGRQE